MFYFLEGVIIGVLRLKNVMCVAIVYIDVYMGTAMYYVPNYRSEKSGHVCRYDVGFNVVICYPVRAER